MFYLNYLTSLTDYCLCLVNISDLRVKWPYSTYWQSDLVHNNPVVLINEPQPRQLTEVQNIPKQQNSSWQSGTLTATRTSPSFSTPTNVGLCPKSLSWYDFFFFFSLQNTRKTPAAWLLCTPNKITDDLWASFLNSLCIDLFQQIILVGLSFGNKRQRTQTRHLA